MASNNAKKRYNLRSVSKLEEAMFGRKFERQSFDRFGDDLCQLILNRLSIEDKLALECVSKQWRSCVYRQQRHLSIEYDRDIYYDSNDSFVRGFESLVKKCANNIQTISLQFEKMCRTIERKLLDIICIYCQNLVSIKCTVGHNNREYSCYQYNWQQMLRLFPNLLSVGSICLSDLVDSRTDCAVLVPKLREIKRLVIDYRLDFVDQFVSRYERTLRALKLDLNDLNRESIVESECFANLLRLTNLETLAIKYECDSIATEFVERVKQVSVKLTKLRSFALDIRSECSSERQINQLFDSLSRVKQLRRLALSSILSAKSELTANALKNCKLLTYIDIDLPISDAFFADIELHLSQLKVIKVITSERISDKSLNYLAKLNQLKVFSIISVSNASITDTGICGLIEKCSQLETFGFDPMPSITMKTIDTLVEVANRRPKIEFYHYFVCENTENSKRILNRIRRSTFAQNLIIIADYGVKCH